MEVMPKMKWYLWMKSLVFQSIKRQEGNQLVATWFINLQVFSDQADIDKNTIDYSGVTGTLIPGDMKFEDVDGDGKIDGDDQVRLDKNITPTLNYGFTADLRYKDFDLSILFQGACGCRHSDSDRIW